MIALLALLVAVAAAGTPAPHHPQWPSSFSTTVVIHEGGVGRPYFARWFYDATKNVDKLDGLAEWAGELYFAQRFFNHRTKQEFELFWQRDLVSCFTRPLNNPLPKPDFTNFTYVGEALIDYVPVYHWVFRRDRDFFQFFDTVEHRRPARFDADRRGRPGLSIQYREFDRSRQDGVVFEVPAAILPTCQQIPAGLSKESF